MMSACRYANLGRNRKLFKDAPENKERTAKLVRLDLEASQDHKAVARAICRKWERCEIKCKSLQVTIKYASDMNSKKDKLKYCCNIFRNPFQK